LAVGNCCYVAVCSAAQSASARAHGWRRGSGAYRGGRRPTACYDWNSQCSAYNSLSGGEECVLSVSVSVQLTVERNVLRGRGRLCNVKRPRRVSQASERTARRYQRRRTDTCVSVCVCGRGALHSSLRQPTQTISACC